MGLYSNFFSPSTILVLQNQTFGNIAKATALAEASNADGYERLRFSNNNSLCQVSDTRRSYTPTVGRQEKLVCDLSNYSIFSDRE